jgi:hypothetical protein
MRDRNVDRPARAFLKGLGVAMGVFALCSLLLLMPPAGTVLLATLAPFAAGYYGARIGGRGIGSRWPLLGALAGILWSVIQIGILLAVFASFMGTADTFEPYGLSILAALSFSNVSFCILGARTGAAFSRAAA